jgi:hypothetical protein
VIFVAFGKEVLRNSSKVAHLRGSFRPPLLIGLPEGYQVLYAPQPIGYAAHHSRVLAKCTMNLNEFLRVASYPALLKLAVRLGSSWRGNSCCLPYGPVTVYAVAAKAMLFATPFNLSSRIHARDNPDHWPKPRARRVPVRRK